MWKGLGIAAALAAVASVAYASNDRWWPFIHGYIAPAEAAYVLLETRPFEDGTFERAARLIQIGRQRGGQAAWVYIALAKATLVYGYQGGSRYRSASFRRPAVDRARRLAARAVAVGPREFAAHVLWARIAIMEGRPRLARRWLDRAQRLDPGNFRLWYYRSIIQRRLGHFERARAYLDKAEARREHRYQRRWVRTARRMIASARADCQPISMRMPTTSARAAKTRRSNTTGSVCARRAPIGAQSTLVGATAAKAGQ